MLFFFLQINGLQEILDSLRVLLTLPIGFAEIVVLVGHLDVFMAVEFNALFQSLLEIQDAIR